MSRILLIEPYEFLVSQYREGDSYAVYAGKTIAYWSHGERRIREIGYPRTIPSDIDLEAIKAKITWSMPLWSRWMGQADQYEDYRQTCLLFIIHLVQVLHELEVRSVIFFTGVSHHIEYSLIEAACQIAKAQQIYLYLMPFFTKQSRLLPLVQSDSIRDRRVLGVNVSDRDACDAVIAYRDNHLSDQPPQLNQKIDHVATSYSYALRRAVIFGLKTQIKMILRRNASAVRHPIDERRDYDFPSILRFIKHQKTALDYYLRVMLDETAVDRMVEIEGALPIIYAHYQPEATTFPEGGDYANHLDVIIAIRKLGYSGKILYKEHPASWIYYSEVVGFSRVGLCRSVDYYQKLIALGCVPIPPSYNLHGHRLQQLFPVTITGSIGVERSLIGLATCCAGLPWFKGAPGVYDLAATFGEDGVFFDRQRWQFDPLKGIEWFARTLSKKTIGNYPGIGTGVASNTIIEKTEFLKEFETLMNQISKQ